MLNIRKLYLYFVYFQLYVYFNSLINLCRPNRMGGQKWWLLTFSLHCLCSSTSHLFTSCLRLVYWSTLKIANDLPIFAFYYALVCICYCFSHPIGLPSVTWLSLLYKFTRFFYLCSVSLWRRANARNVRLYYPYWHRSFYISICISTLPTTLRLCHILRGC